MTFAEIQTAVGEYCILTSGPAMVRIGAAINRHYRRITASIGLDPARYISRAATTTNGVGTVIFTSLEKIDRVVDVTTASALVLLQEVSVHELRSTQPGTSAPQRWAFLNSDADSVTILLDTLPQTPYSLRADGWTTLADLAAADEPAFPESYHDILVWYVISEELLKKEKDKLALIYKTKADTLLSELRFFLADSHTRDTVQGKRPVLPATGSAGGGSGSNGGTAYTQSALITFDRGASTAPFAVAQSTAPYVANLGAEFLGNVTTDRLIGRDTAGTGESELLTVSAGLEFTGAGGIGIAALGVTAAKLAADAVTNVKVAAGAAIAWAKISKAGSALSDLTTVSASDLTSGTVADARMAGATFKAADGTVAAPGLTFANEPDCGVYKEGTNAIAIATAGVKAIGIDSTQFVDSPTQPRCVAYHSTTQNVTTDAVLVFDSEDLDVGGMHSTSSNTSRITIPTGGDGFYHVHARINLNTSASGSASMSIYKNGTTKLRERTVFSASSGQVDELTWMGNLVAVDYLEIFMDKSDGSSWIWGSATAGNANALSVVKLW